MSEELIVRNCSPTLAGIKTGNIFSCSFDNPTELKRDIRELNRSLVKKGLRVLPLKYSEKRALIYIFRPDMLKRDLEDERTSMFLKEYGYVDNNPERCVVQLIERLRKEKEFPHEIGMFLGYPPEDVIGFIENKACNSKYIGCWKVYGDVDKAKRTFEMYKKCENSYFRMWQNGVSIEKLAVVR